MPGLQIALAFAFLKKLRQVVIRNYVFCGGQRSNPFCAAVNQLLAVLGNSLSL